MITHDVALDRLNTFGLPCRAAHFATITDPAQLISLIGQYQRSSLPWFVLGGGSNLIVRSDFEGLVLHMRILGRALVAENADAWFVRAGAGENWHDFVRWTLQQGWPGLENLALIPGTVGAAPVQNIGAYGLELCDRFQQLEAVDLTTGEQRVFDRAACHFGYRESVFKQAAAGECAITAVTFRIPKHWEACTEYAEVAQALATRQPSAQDIFDMIVAIRRAKLPDPAQIGNAGSFFKNPLVDATHFAQLIADHPHMPHYPQRDGTVKLAAGWLIEQAGWKGRSLGRAGVYEQQALILVNRGGATGQEVLALAAAIQAAVQAMFAVVLAIEPVVL